MWIKYDLSGGNLMLFSSIACTRAYIVGDGETLDVAGPLDIICCKLCICGDIQLQLCIDFDPDVTRVAMGSLMPGT